MTPPLSKSDERRLHRFLDGELPSAERQELQSRLAAEPALRTRLAELEQLRSCFRVGVGAGRPAPGGFTGDVLAAIRQGVTDQGWRQADDAGPDVVRFCRRLLVAAAVLAGLALLAHTGLFRPASGVLEASPDLARRIEAELAARLQSGPATPAPERRGSAVK